jgi:hypothetical protein
VETGSVSCSKKTRIVTLWRLPVLLLQITLPTTQLVFDAVGCPAEYLDCSYRLGRALMSTGRNHSDVAPTGRHYRASPGPECTTGARPAKVLPARRNGGGCRGTLRSPVRPVPIPVGEYPMSQILKYPQHAGHHK